MTAVAPRRPLTNPFCGFVILPHLEVGLKPNLFSPFGYFFQLELEGVYCLPVFLAQLVIGIDLMGGMVLESRPARRVVESKAYRSRFLFETGWVD